MIVNHVLIAFIYCAATIYAQSEGEKCRANEQNGICVPIQYCDEALYNIRPKIETCGFDGKEWIVCCVAHHLKALEKCLEYYPKPNLFRARISEGTTSGPGEFPHMVALGFGPDSHIRWLCGGSLISENYVLTVAHCVGHIEHGIVRKIIAGAINLRHLDHHHNQMFDVKKVVVHPKYTRTAKYHDIALIELNKDAKFNRYVRPICLQRYHKLPNSILLTATGFGKTELLDADKNYDLYKVNLVHYDNTYCNDIFIDPYSLERGILRSQLCAGNRGDDKKDTCEGDSGGPLFYEMDRFFYLVGVTAFGKSCGAPGIPTVYTRVSPYLTWIESIVWH